MYCRKCEKELPDGAAYCPRCGTPVNGIPAAQEPPSPCAEKLPRNGFAIACFALALFSLLSLAEFALFAWRMGEIYASGAAGWDVLFMVILGGIGLTFSFTSFFAAAALALALGVVGLVVRKTRRANWFAVAGLAIVAAAVAVPSVLAAL